MILIIKLIYFMLPTYFANMAPVFGRFVFKRFNHPISKRLCGEHKTWKGLILGVLAAIIVSFIQYKLNIQELKLYDYNDWLLFGFLMGFGALFGDALKSFFKRRFNINPGNSWIPFDQIDFVIGSLFFSSFIFFIGWKNIFIIIIISFLLHIITNHVAYYLRIRDEKW